MKVANDFVCTCEALNWFECICTLEFDDEDEHPADEEEQCKRCGHWNQIPVAWHECERCNEPLN